MRRRRVPRRVMAEINVVPFIDVMLVLLVIFMIATPLMTQGVKVNLPNAKANRIQTQPPPIIVTVDRMGQYFINASPAPSMPVSADQMVNLVAADLLVAQQKSETLPVYVNGDRDADYGSVMNAMVLLQRAGVDAVGLLTRMPDGM